jgi:hypothetical protein
MLARRQIPPNRAPPFRVEFTILRLRLLKIAARIVESTARIRVSLPSACPEAGLFCSRAGRFATAGP